jgi:hypothetical protein
MADDDESDPGSQFEAEHGHALIVNEADLVEATGLRLNADYEATWTEEQVDIVKDFVRNNQKIQSKEARFEKKRKDLLKTLAQLLEHKFSGM